MRGGQEEEKVDEIRRGRQPKIKNGVKTEGGKPRESSTGSEKGAEAREGNQSASPIP
jgi:hypothetical protein